jgi:hypothetical protein
MELKEENDCPGSGRADEVRGVHANVSAHGEHGDGPGAFSGLGLVSLARLCEEGAREHGWTFMYLVLETAREAVLGESAAGVLEADVCQERLGCVRSLETADVGVIKCKGGGGGETEKKG